VIFVIYRGPVSSGELISGLSTHIAVSKRRVVKGAMYRCLAIAVILLPLTSGPIEGACTASDIISFSSPGDTVVGGFVGKDFHNQGITLTLIKSFLPII
jgi:hypothetical protein